jgi:two-component system sensor kinase FixL
MILQRVGRGERVDHFETVRRRKNGSDIFVSLTISPIRNQHGHLVGISKIARDISAQRAAQHHILQLQSELLHASRIGTLGQMSAAIAHELKQPLSAVNSYLAGVARGLSKSDAAPMVVDAVARAREQATRAGEIVRRLFDLAAKREPDLRVESINEVVDEILGVALVDARLRGVKTRVFLPPGLKPVRVDRVQIGQVILNIVRNAIEAMDGLDECNLTISTAADPEQNRIQLRIADTGPGLPPNVRERLFEPFVTTKDKGMGIGLSICHNIIDSHRGRLSAEPNEPTGTVFVICVS